MEERELWVSKAVETSLRCLPRDCEPYTDVIKAIRACLDPIQSTTAFLYSNSDLHQVLVRLVAPSSEDPKWRVIAWTKSESTFTKPDPFPKPPEDLIRLHLDIH